MSGLTRTMYRVQMFIQRYIADNGVSPTYDEIKDALEFRSKSGVMRVVTKLEQRGYLRRLKHCARSLEIIRHLEPISSNCPLCGAHLNKPTSPASRGSSHGLGGGGGRDVAVGTHTAETP